MTKWLGRTDKSRGKRKGPTAKERLDELDTLEARCRADMAAATAERRFADAESAKLQLAKVAAERRALEKETLQRRQRRDVRLCEKKEEEATALARKRWAAIGKAAEARAAEKQRQLVALHADGERQLRKAWEEQVESATSDSSGCPATPSSPSATKASSHVLSMQAAQRAALARQQFKHAQQLEDEMATIMAAERERERLRRAKAMQHALDVLRKRQGQELAAAEQREQKDRFRLESCQEGQLRLVRGFFARLRADLLKQHQIENGQRPVISDQVLRSRHRLHSVDIAHAGVHPGIPVDMARQMNLLSVLDAELVVDGERNERGADEASEEPIPSPIADAGIISPTNAVSMEAKIPETSRPASTHRPHRKIHLKAALEGAPPIPDHELRRQNRAYARFTVPGEEGAASEEEEEDETDATDSDAVPDVSPATDDVPVPPPRLPRYEDDVDDLLFSNEPAAPEERSSLALVLGRLERERASARAAPRRRATGKKSRRKPPKATPRRVERPPWNELING